jgi:hypothetical protein
MGRESSLDSAEAGQASIHKVLGPGMVPSLGIAPTTNPTSTE